MSTPETISELDLLAYADGLLDHDPGRKARVEAYLRTAPEASERVRAYQAQTRALRDIYGGKAEEPVPPHLCDLVAERPRPGSYRVAARRAAAVVAVSVATGLSGWFLGQQGAQGPQQMADRLPSIVRHLAGQEPTTPTADQASLRPRVRGGVLRWHQDGATVSLRVPDLSALGYELADRTILHYAGSRVVRLTYESAHGALRLFIAPGAQRESQPVSVSAEGGAPIAYWSQGPLTIAALADGDERDIANLAEQVRGAVQRGSERPLQRPEQPDLPIPPGRLDVTADVAAPQATDSLESTVGHSPVSVEKRVE